MANTFNVLNPLQVSRPCSNVDAAYGPYNSIEEALAAFPLARRVLGRTVGILDSERHVREYWWKDGLTDEDLIGKETPQIFFSVETEPSSHKVIWVDTDDSAASGSSFTPPSGSVLYTMQQQIALLEQKVTELMKVITYGALAGDSTTGGRTSIMNESIEGINPTTGEVEPIEPTNTGSITVPNIKIKNDTAANFRTNYRNLLDGELVWVRSGEYITPTDPGLHMFSNNSGSFGFIPIGSGTPVVTDLTAIFQDGYIVISGSGATIDENSLISLTSSLVSVDSDGYITI